MTRCLTRILMCTALLSSLLTLPTHAADEPILLIDQASGQAGVQRDGKRLNLKSGDALQEQDLIVTGGNGRMTLRLGRHGFVEVGPDAEVGVERLPFAAFARDLKSIFSVSKGYLRVVWKHPQQSSNWPLYVYMAGQRVSLSSGEYFFQNAGAEQTACVAAGQIALQAVGGDGVETIKPPACVQFAADTAAKTTPRNPDDWIAVRRSFSLAATAQPVEVVTPIPTAAPVVAAAKPVISTAVAPTAPSLPKPTAIAPVASAALPRPTATPAPTAAPVTKTAAIIIGEVQTLPATKPASAAPVVAKPPTVVTSAPTNSGDGAWTLNVASSSDQAVAEREVSRLRAAGYGTASTQAINISGKTWYRVQISGFASDEAARAAARQLKENLGLQNVWVLKP